MSRKRPARTGNPDLRQQKHVPAPPIEEIEKEIFSLLSPVSFKPLRLYENEQNKKYRDRILTLPMMMAIVVSLVYRQIPGLREVQRVLSRIGIVMGGTNRSNSPSSVKKIANITN
ncbi:transposase (plasmid) [Nostoc carneum NIES-2107]|nr:transposase [Nostoc carneum NIES-2107]BAY33946.1 transposase [Nostoc carneum NIES-2107]BAY35002.1 transposase [Nostoc carneum NIES-2107]